jgi:hypothetical protein
MNTVVTVVVMASVMDLFAFSTSKKEWYLGCVYALANVPHMILQHRDTKIN